MSGIKKIGRNGPRAEIPVHQSFVVIFVAAELRRTPPCVDGAWGPGKWTEKWEIEYGLFPFANKTAWLDGLMLVEKTVAALLLTT